MTATLVLRFEFASTGYLWFAILPACLVESFFYVSTLFEHTRSWFRDRGHTAGRFGALIVSAILPYLILTLGSGTFQVRAFVLLTFLVLVLAGWHLVLPRRVVYDAGFLAIAAAPVVVRAFGRIYPSFASHLKLDILGQLMWIRIAVVALLVFREWNPGPFGLWPKAREWKVGMFWFSVSIVPLACLAVAVNDVRFAVPELVRGLELMVGTFFGFFWISGLGEELYFRGVIERALFSSTRQWPVAVVASALLFGSVHLWFHTFPDWQRAATASCLGLSCGAAYAQTGSIRASMVTHSMAVAVLKTFFRA